MVIGYFCQYFMSDVKIMMVLFWTGKEAENATLSHGVIMCQAIKKYHNITGYQVHNIYFIIRFAVTNYRHFLKV